MRRVNFDVISVFIMKLSGERERERERKRENTSLFYQGDRLIRSTQIAYVVYPSFIYLIVTPRASNFISGTHFATRQCRRENEDLN